MFKIRGFITSDLFVNNLPNEISTFGELSTTARTYSRDTGLYTNSDHGDVELITFHSSLDGEDVSLNPDDSELTLRIAQRLTEASVSGLLTEDEIACREYLLTQFSELVEINAVGTMLFNDAYWMPSSITFKRLNDDTTDFKVWFSDEAFRQQYELYDVIIVPTIEPDLLQLDRQSVMDAIDAVDYSDHLLKMKERTDGKPYTDLLYLPFTWVDKNDPTVKATVRWTVVIHGQAGHNSDVIREAIIDYIMSNTTYSRAAWELMFPDLFTPNEFYVAPLWHKYSLENQTTATGLYSPTVRVSELLQHTLDSCAGMTETHLNEYMTVSSVPYKSMLFTAVGLPGNRDELYSFDVLWTKYANLTPSHHDYYRLPPEVQSFVLRLVELLIAAESHTVGKPLAAGFSSVLRGGLRYLTTTIDTVQYLVKTKED